MDNMTLLNFSNIIRQLAEPTIENFSDEEIVGLLKITSKKTIYKIDEYFSMPTAPNTSIAYIAKGLFRLYMIDQHGNEATHDFTGDNMFMSSYAAIVLNKICPIYVQALEDSEVYTISREKLIDLWKNDIRWKNILQKATEYDNLEMRWREMELLTFDAKTRYEHFLEYFAKYDGRIKLRYIASYIDVSPETLSRIRAQN